MLLVGPSLGAAVAIDFAINHPEAVSNDFSMLEISYLVIHFLLHFYIGTLVCAKGLILITFLF